MSRDSPRSIFERPGSCRLQSGTAEEIQTPEFGFGFDGILRRRRDEYVGILNGIDTAEWDPARDAALPRPYSADDPSGRAARVAA